MSINCIQRTVAKKNFSCEKCYSNSLYSDEIEDEVFILNKLSTIMYEASSKEIVEEIIVIEENMLEDSTCTSCNFIASSSEILRKHIEHTALPKLNCDSCTISVDTQEHIKLQHNHNSLDNNISCYKCELSVI